MSSNYNDLRSSDHVNLNSLNLSTQSLTDIPGKGGVVIPKFNGLAGLSEKQKQKQNQRDFSSASSRNINALDLHMSTRTGKRWGQKDNEDVEGGGRGTSTNSVENNDERDI